MIHEDHKINTLKSMNSNFLIKYFIVHTNSVYIQYHVEQFNLGVPVHCCIAVH